MQGTKSGLFVAALAAGTLVGMAQADIINLGDVNSSAVIDTGSQAGMSDWIVDGTDHLYQQWFWHRIGPVGGESSLDTLTQLGIFATDTNPFTDPQDDTLAVLYGGNGYTVELNYTLRGGALGSNVSDITEQIIITNTGNRVLDFYFFQYTDLDMGGTASGDTALITGGNTARQWDSASPVQFNETVVTPMPFAYEVNTFPTLINSLNDANPTTLANLGGPQSGDMNWAFQWNFTIAPGQSFIISKDKTIAIPAPGALALLGLGLACTRRRRG